MEQDEHLDVQSGVKRNEVRSPFPALGHDNEGRSFGMGFPVKLY